jgi:hypothetical protein
MILHMSLFQRTYFSDFSTVDIAAVVTSCIVFLALCIGALLLASGIAKVMSFEQFVRAIARYEFPVNNIEPFAVLWIGAEILGGASALVPSTYRFMGALWVVAAATGAVLKRTQQDARHDCGCLPAKREIGKGSLFVNTGILVVLSAAVFSVAGTQSGVGQLTGGLVVGLVTWLMAGSKGRQTVPIGADA